MKKIDLDNKKVLFLGQVFYDYHIKIINELTSEGAEVLFIPNKFHGSLSVSKFDFVGKLRKKIIPISKKKYAKYILEQINKEKFDYLFCIGGFSITPELISGIRNINPEIKTIIYFWDSFKIWDHTNIINLFDAVFSFDSEDVKQNNKISYLPLFYTKEYQFDISVKKDLDFLYVGSITYFSRNRLALLKKVLQFSNKNDLKSFIWVYDGESARGKIGQIHSFFKRIFVSDFRSYVKSLNDPSITFIKKETLKRDEIVSLMKRSKCVIDIPVPEQVGLTIRTIETLALNNKLMTTNTNIINESFYDEKFIITFDELNFDLDPKFINTNPDGKINVCHLGLNEWLLGMFSSLDKA